MRESIALCERTKNRWGMGTAYRYLGLTSLATGRCIEAQDHFQKSLEIFGEYFKGWDIARSLTYLGDAAFMTGDLSEAEETYLDALRLAVEVKSTPLAMDAIAGLARLHLHNGEAEKAFELANYVLNQTASTQETKEISRQLIVKLEKQLGDDRIQAIRERTMDQSLDTIAEICLRWRQPGQLD